MRRFFPLLAIGALLLGGCALTDYGNTNTAPITPKLNKSHVITDPVSDDKIANAQQTIEADCAGLNYAYTASYATRFTPVDTTIQVSAQDCRDWFRFIGPWSFVQEATVTPGGHWAEAGIRDMPDGGIMLRTWNRTQTSGGWGCGAGGLGAVGYKYVGTENCVAGQKLASGPAWNDWHVQTVMVDRAWNTYGWGTNIVAATPARLAGGYSTYSALAGRAYEGHLYDAPVKGPKDGLAEFFAGESMEVSHNGWTVNMSGSVRDDGMIVFSLESIAYNGSSFTPSTPIEVAANRSLQLFEFDAESQHGLVVELATWALENVPMDEGFTVGGFIPELGVYTPERGMYLVSDTIERWLVEQTGNINPRERDRLR
jgi:hypothetical protein